MARIELVDQRPRREFRRHRVLRTAEGRAEAAMVVDGDGARLRKRSRALRLERLRERDERGFNSRYAYAVPRPTIAAAMLTVRCTTTSSRGPEPSGPDDLRDVRPHLRARHDSCRAAPRRVIVAGPEQSRVQRRARGTTRTPSVDMCPRACARRCRRLQHTELLAGDPLRNCIPTPERARLAAPSRDRIAIADFWSTEFPYAVSTGAEARRFGEVEEGSRGGGAAGATRGCRRARGRSS